VGVANPRKWSQTTPGSPVVLRTAVPYVVEKPQVFAEAHGSLPYSQ
jgi:hypothetical protein